jgi:hypothetical protein
VLYRADQFDAARAELQEAIRLRGDTGGTPEDWLFLAMVEHRQDHADKAREWLQKAVRWMDVPVDARVDPRGDAALTNEQWLQLLVLRREAEELLGRPATKPNE